MRKLPRWLPLLVLLVAWTRAPAAAQQPFADAAELRVGTRVRITSSWLPEGRAVGLFRSLTPDSLRVVRRPGGALSLPLSAVSHLERSRIDRGRGALIGGAAGGVAGAALFALLAAERPFLDAAESAPRDIAVVGLMVGLPLGGVVGALLGGAAGAEVWSPIPR